jgi:hypothetical protein
VAAELAPGARSAPGASGAIAIAGPARAWLWATITLTAGAIVAAIALAPPASAPAGRGLAYLLFVGSSAHVASTGWFYTLPEIRGHMRQHSGRYVWAPLALIAGAGAIAAAVPPVALEWLTLPYFAWQFFHYQKQNLGVAALAAAAHRVSGLRRGERRALLAAGLAGVAGLVAHPRLLQLPVGREVNALFVLAAAAFAVAVAAGLCCLARRPAGQRPAGLCAAYGCGLAFWLPVFVFGSPYAAVAGITIAHGLQYLLLMGLVAAGGARIGGGARMGGGGRVGGGRARGLLQVAALFNIAMVGGGALAFASDLQHSAAWPRVLFGVFLGAVMAHFVVDAGLWRLRDQFPRAFLTERVPYLVPAPATADKGPATDPSLADISSIRA